MSCYKPIEGYRARFLNEKTGKRPIVFDKVKGYQDLKVTLPCGRCIGCKLEKSREWAMRCVHESELYENNCFLTLTYNNENVKMSLDKRDITLFFKRLRKHVTKFSPDYKIRYFQCGEYGELFERPHHHVCLFNFDFDDKVLYKEEQGGIRLYVSETLNKIWQQGYCIIGELNFETAAYTARYITKKITGKKAEGHYQGRIPEYCSMSRRDGGIGYKWYEKYKKGMYDNDRVIINGKESRPPRYYDKKFEDFDSEKMEDVLSKRRQLSNTKIRKRERFQERLDVKNELQQIRFKKFKRSYEVYGC